MNETHKAQAGNNIEFVLRDYLRELPTYDGDLDINTDTQTPPAVVVDFRRELSEAHAIIIGTPEYNYNGDRKVRQELRLILKNNGLPPAGELFDQAYAYISENY